MVQPLCQNSHCPVCVNTVAVRPAHCVTLLCAAGGFVAWSQSVCLPPAFCSLYKLLFTFDQVFIHRCTSSYKADVNNKHGLQSQSTLHNSLEHLPLLLYYSVVMTWFYGNKLQVWWAIPYLQHYSTIYSTKEMQICDGSKTIFPLSLLF